MFTDIRIDGGNIAVFPDMIPKNYVDQILKAELSAVATYDGDDEDKNLVGISVTGEHAGWLELVWMVMGEKYANLADAGSFVRYVIRRAERSGEYVGVFSELHMDEQTEQHRNVLLLAGMEIREAKNNIYELSLSEISHEELFYEAAGKSDCVFIKDAPEELLEMFEDSIDDDERPIPAPGLINWEGYVQELSLICTEGGKPAGGLLFTEEKDYLVLMLAYSTTAKALPGMIGTVLKKAREIYPPDKKILIPLVGKGVAEIIEKLAPKAKRGDIIQAVVRFEQKTVPKSMEYIMRQMMNVQ